MPSWLLIAGGTATQSSLQCHRRANHLGQRGQGCVTGYGGRVPGDRKEQRLKGELAVHQGQMSRNGFPCRENSSTQTRPEPQSRRV